MSTVHVGVRVRGSLLAAVTLLVLTGCTGADGTGVEPGVTASASSASGSGIGEPAAAYDESTGPRAGTCLAMATTEDVWAPEAIPCDEPHGGEVVRLLADTADAWHDKPGKELDWKRLGDRCHHLTEDVGYDGPLLGLHVSLLVTASPEARAEGAHWVACTLATMAPFTDGMPTGQHARTPLTQRRGVYADIAGTGRTWIMDGVRCYRYGDRGAAPADCLGQGNVWAHLTYDQGLAPFVSADWQERVARSKCEAYGYAFGVPGHDWYATWPETAAELDDSKICLVRASDFDPDRNVVIDLPEEVSGLTGTAAAFAAYVHRYGRAFTRDPRLMAVPGSEADTKVRSDLALNFALRAWPGPGSIGSTGVSTRGIGMTHRLELTGFEGERCSAQLEVPLPYLGAPFSVTEVRCR